MRRPARPPLSQAGRTRVEELDGRGARDAGRAMAVHPGTPALEQSLAESAIMEDVPGRPHRGRAAPVRVGRGRVWSALRFTLAVVTGSLLLAWIYSPLKGLVIAAVLVILDRLLLVLESRGWVNYRRVGLSRGAATYHTLELSSAFNPGFEEVIEAKYAVERHEDDSGGPPAPDDE